MLPALQSRFDEIEQQRVLLLARLSSKDPASLSYHPGAGSWSMLQVVQHLVLVEQLVMTGMIKPARPMVKRRWWHRVGAWLVAFVFRHGFRVPAPSKAVVPLDDMPLDVSERSWVSLRVQLRAFLEEITPERSGQLGFRHFVSGPHDIAGTLDFIRSHFDHHLRQIGRIEASASRSGVAR